MRTTRKTGRNSQENRTLVTPEMIAAAVAVLEESGVLSEQVPHDHERLADLVTEILTLSK